MASPMKWLLAPRTLCLMVLPSKIIVQNSLNTETYKLILNNVDVLPSSGGGSSSVSHAIDSSEDTEHSTKLDGAQQF